MSLPIPKSYAGDDTPPLANTPILIYGGGSTAAQYTIQLLKAAGYKKILTTASPHHHEYLKSLGATDVFDYRSTSLTEDVIKAAGGKIKLVLDSITAEATIAAISKFIDPEGTLAILLPIKKGDRVRADGDASAMSFELSPGHPLAKTVLVKSVRAFLYQEVSILLDAEDLVNWLIRMNTSRII